MRAAFKDCNHYVWKESSTDATTFLRRHVLIFRAHSIARQTLFQTLMLERGGGRP